MVQTVHRPQVLLEPPAPQLLQGPKASESAMIPPMEGAAGSWMKIIS